MTAEAAPMEAARPGMAGFLLAPFDDYVAAIDAMRGRGWSSWLAVLVAGIVAWFLYVPVHELLHAAGCLATGGTVTRLEIAPEYGGALLARVVPFVVSGSAYAGQLTGFDTHGNDGIYLATVLAPFLLTVFVGVPMLRSAARATTRASLRPLLLGASLPIAFAPFVSMTGDYYETGSILVTRLATALGLLEHAARWRSDDTFKLVRMLADQGATTLDWMVVGTSFAAGLGLGLLTYHAGRGWRRKVAEPGNRQEA